MANNMMSMRDYAREVLRVYSSRIAQDRLDALLYMTVGAGRFRLLNQLVSTMHDFLSLDGNNGTPRGAYLEVVLGEFGAGKSHIGYMHKHSALTCGHELMVAHAQITGEARFPSMLGALLRTLRIAGVESLRMFDIELSAYVKMVEWVGGSRRTLEEFLLGRLGNMSRGIVNDLVAALWALQEPNRDASALQMFIDAWVAKADPKTALQTFEFIMATFSELKCDRCSLLIDEFEALESLTREEQLAALQSLQDLHDDFAGRKDGLPAVHMIIFSTEKWWNAAAGMLPSLCGRGDRTRGVASIPDLNKLDVAGLVHRYLSLMQLIETNCHEPDKPSYDAAVEGVWSELEKEQRVYHMRTVHALARDAAKQLLAGRRGDV